MEPVLPQADAHTLVIHFTENMSCYPHLRPALRDGHVRCSEPVPWPVA